MIRLRAAAVALLLAGSFFLCGGGYGRVKSGVCIDGIDVGGMPYAAAEARVRAARTDVPFTVRLPDGEDFSPVLTVTDDLGALVRRAKKNESLLSRVRREWADAETELLALCKKYACTPSDAEVSFSADGFTYSVERGGLACLYGASLRAALSALKEGKTEVSLLTSPLAPQLTAEDLRARTRKLASYTTYYDGSNAPRAGNIALAARRIAGTTLGAGEEFSFNACVGARTRENGFGEAKVIFEGEFVDGVGGGVCQASTTLMNAALRAGLTVTESRPHSLSVSYAPPSLDAMVSEYSDLKFVNPYAFPVYLAARTTSSSVTFTVYGAPDGLRYETESRVLFRLTPPPEQLVEGEEDAVVRAAREGLASESYLLVYRGGELLSRTLFRRDTYAVVQGVRQIKRVPPEEREEREQKEGDKEAETGIFLKNPVK